MTSYYYPNLDWDVRYPPNWADIRRATHEATGGICCLCQRNLSVEAHHSRYLWKGDTPGLIYFRCVYVVTSSRITLKTGVNIRVILSGKVATQRNGNKN